MSKYTTEVRYICEVNAGLTESKGYNDVEKIITDSRTKIFDFDYPIFDNEYRSVLERKILRHYYTREIGFESVGLWKLKLNMKLNDIMPYYNQLYESELLEFNPLHDVNLTIDHKRDNSGSDSRENTGTSNNSGNSTSTTNYSNTTDFDSVRWDEYSDTPQGTVGNLDNLTYLTNARKNTADDTTDVTGTSTTTGSYTDTGRTTGNENGEFESTEDYLEHIVGKRNGYSYSKMLTEYRETFLNIDLMIIEELSDLFMYLW